MQQLAEEHREARGRPCGSLEENGSWATEEMPCRDILSQERTHSSRVIMSWMMRLIQVFLVLIATVLAAFVGVWMYPNHSFLAHWLLDVLPGLAAFLGKALVVILVVGLAISVMKGIWRWLDGVHTVTLQGLYDTVPRIVAIIGKTLLLVLLLVVGTAFVRIIGAWIFGGDSITIASFTDTRADASAESGSKLGDTLTDALTTEIHRINQLHTLRNPWGSADEAPPLEMTGPQAYERVGTVSVAGLEMPVGEVALALKPLLPSWHDRYVISGSLQQALSGRAMVGQLITRLEENGRTRKHWNRELPFNDTAELYRHLQQLAYEIMWNTLEGVEADSLENFRHLIEGIQAFRTYKETRDLEAFGVAEQSLKRAIDTHPKYARAHFYLGHLYTWRARFEGAQSANETNYTAQAIAAYRNAGRGYTSQLYEANAFENFGLGLVYYRMYSKMTNTPPPYFTDNLANLDFILTGARHYFTAAIRNDDRFYFARTGLALIYKKQAELIRTWEERSERVDMYFNCAIREFQHAKYIAAYRQDKDSVRWLDMNISELERIRRDGARPWSWLLDLWHSIHTLRGPCPDTGETLASAF
jgi:hypothetical protein